MTATPWLGLMWLASPALPVGGFSYSEGLEAAIEAGAVHDETSATAWLQAQFELSLVRSEIPVLAHAAAAWVDTDAARSAAEVASLNAWLLQTRESAEFRLMTTQMGRSLAAWLAQQAPDDARVACLQALPEAPTWPVAFALAAVRTGAPVADIAAAFAFGWCENMVQAAVKAVPLGQSAGQRVLGALVPGIATAVARALAAPAEARQSFAPMLAVLSLHHETQYSRLFRS
jgi:urease accessory protein